MQLPKRAWKTIYFSKRNKFNQLKTQCERTSIYGGQNSKKLVTFEINLCLLFSAYFQKYSIKLSPILEQENIHVNAHFSFRNYFKIQIGKVWKRTSKMVHVQNFKTGHRPWPLVEETFITFEPPPRILRSLYRWNRIEKLKNTVWEK